MASSAKTCAFLVLFVSSFIVCLCSGDGQEILDPMLDFGYETGSRVNSNSPEADDVTVVGLDETDKENNAAPMHFQARDFEQLGEPQAIRKEALCLGCPTVLDLSVPQVRMAVESLLGRALRTLKSESAVEHNLPNILSATKQVVSGIKYSVVYQQDSEAPICVIEFLEKASGTHYLAYNNCTDDLKTDVTVGHPLTSTSPNNIPSSESEAKVETTMTVDSTQSIENVDGHEGISGSDGNEPNAGSYPTPLVSRETRSTHFGALRDVDKSEQDLVNQFAQLAVKTLDEVDPDNTKRIVLGVPEAKKQIVNGIMYHLVIQVGTSSCQESEVTNADVDCVENHLYPEKVCRVQIHRSWADESSPLNAKVVKSECADVWPEDFPYEPSSRERVRRSSQENWPSTDGWKKYEPSDLSQDDCFEKVMTSFKDVLNVKNVSKVATIRDAHTRVNKESLQPEMVVTILLTDPQKLKMLGDVKKPMVVSSRVVCTQRLRRSPGIPGGFTDVNVNDPRVMEITQFAMSEIQKSVNSPYQHTLVRIIEARSQVVAGTRYYFKLEVAPTSCFKSDQSSSNCASSNSEQLLVCTLYVFDQPWTKLREVQDLNCGSSRQKREEREEPLLGGPQHIDVDDPYVKELATFALAEIDKGLNSPYQQKVVRVVEAKTQVVAGTLMHLKLELATTNCLKSEMVSSENCVHNADQPTTMCSLKIWDRLWLKKRELQDLQCGRTRAKRELKQETQSYQSQSQFLKVDVKDPYAVDSANAVVEEMDRLTNTPYRQKLLQIVSAEVQHSDVTNVKLKLLLGRSSCKKSSKSKSCGHLKGGTEQTCTAHLLHVPWLNIRRVTSLECDSFKSGNVLHSPNLSVKELEAADLFRRFMRNFNKTYSSDEELQKRFSVFKSNLKVIELLQKGEQGTARYGPTIFADLSPQEFKAKYMGLRHDLKQENAVPMQMAHIPNIKLPESFDWRGRAVTSVKNQGACGSCWAFAVTGNLEGQYAIKHGKLLSLSEQELVDCDTLDDGCKGGLPENAYHALEKLGGVETESDYPYEGRDDQCQFNSSEVKVRVKSSVNVTTDEIGMAKWLVKNGPIAIGINANAMQFYVGGVSHPFKFLCSPGNLDHGVLIVGYGVHTTSIRHKVLPYWIIKNSWGTFWGEKGYYRVYRGDGTCGVNQMASSAVVE